ncbi:MAG: peptide deformylase [Rhodospirillaceae bacterium]|nr:peptide deformylase [Rhodospirillaceae bacterium]MCY4238202.1 peptide deformylase [Rhodospirillaceae bacterium]
MARRSILEYPHPRLRGYTQAVTAFDRDLGDLVDDLIDTLDATESLALSAPQVDDGRAVLVIAPRGGPSVPRTYVNPKILSKRAWGIVQESCLSLPGVVGNVLRATEIRVRACSPDGKAFETDLSGMDAVCLQHEIDHLDGKLFVDHLSIIGRLRFHAFAGRRARRRHQPA